MAPVKGLKFAIICLDHGPLLFANNGHTATKMAFLFLTSDIDMILQPDFTIPEITFEGFTAKNAMFPFFVAFHCVTAATWPPV